MRFTFFRFLQSLFALALLAPVAVAQQPDALDQVNAQRAARGLPAFQRDPALTVAAQGAATFRARAGLFGHTSNDFSFLPAGASADAAGCAAYPSSYGFMACCTYENYTHAGAASVLGADGKMYSHLFVKSGTPTAVAAAAQVCTAAGCGPQAQVQGHDSYRVIATPGRVAIRERHHLFVGRPRLFGRCR